MSDLPPPQWAVYSRTRQRYFSMGEAVSAQLEYEFSRNPARPVVLTECFGFHGRFIINFKAMLISNTETQLHYRVARILARRDGVKWRFLTRSQGWQLIPDSESSRLEQQFQVNRAGALTAEGLLGLPGQVLFNLLNMTCYVVDTKESLSIRRDEVFTYFPEMTTRVKQESEIDDLDAFLEPPGPVAPVAKSPMQPQMSPQYADPNSSLVCVQDDPQPDFLGNQCAMPFFSGPPLPATMPHSMVESMSYDVAIIHLTVKKTSLYVQH